MKSPRLILSLVLLGLITIVVLQNTETVETRIFFATAMPRTFRLMGTLAIGVLAGFLLGARFQRKRQASRA